MSLTIFCHRVTEALRIVLKVIQGEINEAIFIANNFDDFGNRNRLQQRQCSGTG
jgi:hypothetical protein